MKSAEVLETLGLNLFAEAARNLFDTLMSVLITYLLSRLHCGMWLVVAALYFSAFEGSHTVYKLVTYCSRLSLVEQTYTEMNQFMLNCLKNA